MCELPEHVVKSDAAHDEAINDYTTICSCMTRAQLDTLISYECFDVFYLDFDMYDRNTLIQQFADDVKCLTKRNKKCISCCLRYSGRIHLIIL